MSLIEVDPKQLTKYTVDRFKPADSRTKAQEFDKTVYSFFYRATGEWRSIDADFADSEMQKMGKIPYSQKKAFLWELAKINPA